MIVRAYEMPDGTVRILVPNEKRRLPGESDAAFIVRLAARAERKDPSLKTALRSIDVDKTIVDGLDRSKRYAYRFDALKTAVVVDPSVPVPVDPRAAAIDAETSFTAAQRAAMKRILGVR